MGEDRVEAMVHSANKIAAFLDLVRQIERKTRVGATEGHKNLFNGRDFGAGAVDLVTKLRRVVQRLAVFFKPWPNVETDTG